MLGIDFEVRRTRSLDLSLKIDLIFSFLPNKATIIWLWQGYFGGTNYFLFTEMETLFLKTTPLNRYIMGGRRSHFWTAGRSDMIRWGRRGHSTPPTLVMLVIRCNILHSRGFWKAEKCPDIVFVCPHHISGGCVKCKPFRPSVRPSVRMPSGLDFALAPLLWY